MTIGELKEQLTSFTAEYKKTLVKQTQAVLEYEKLEGNFKKLQNECLSANSEETNNTGESEGENLEVINLEAKLEKLKLELVRAESEVELDIRRTHGKATESHIKALVGTDEKVFRLRNRIVDGKAYIKTKKADTQRAHRENWEKEKQKRIQLKIQPEGEELNSIQEKLVLAKREKLLAGNEMEVLRTKLETLKLLVALVKND